VECYARRDRRPLALKIKYRRILRDERKILIWNAQDLHCAEAKLFNLVQFA